MNAPQRPVPNPNLSGLQVIVQLHDALTHADRELRRRCVISTQISEALAAAETFLQSYRR
jgi:hypothetical protein